MKDASDFINLQFHSVIQAIDHARIFIKRVYFQIIVVCYHENEFLFGLTIGQFRGLGLK